MCFIAKGKRMKLLQIGNHWINEDKVIGFYDVEIGKGFVDDREVMHYAIEARWVEGEKVLAQVVQKYTEESDADLIFKNIFASRETIEV